MKKTLASQWVFGYGSLIWRPGFLFADKRLATVTGYSRRFCQASHDHRGTPDAPGRVATLASVPNSLCQGVAFRIEECVDEILDLLDVREQDGYERQLLTLTFEDGSTEDGITWIAAEGNPSWREGESLSEVAQVIAQREGPSGSNRDYLFELHRALLDANITDTYIENLYGKVRSLST